jgi:nicotinamidase-related amidase
MFALIVVDAQNEFSPEGKRPIATHAEALRRIKLRVQQAREAGVPIAWVQHHNLPHESPAFMPGSWGAELSPGLGPQPDSTAERLFQKTVFGAFTGNDLEHWLRGLQVTRVLLVGFYAHMCVSTTSREALVRGFDVIVDPLATGAADLKHELFGAQSADEVRRAALLHLSHMGVNFAATEAAPWSTAVAAN